MYDELGVPSPHQNPALVTEASSPAAMVTLASRLRAGVHPEPGRDHVSLQGEEVDRPVQRVVPRLGVVDTADVVVAFTLLVVVTWRESGRAR